VTDARRVRDGGSSGPGPTPWEAAYLRFETPEQETRKFLARLETLGAGRWPRDVRVIELFCGRGNGLRALARLGFSRVLGVDLSPTLVGRSDRRGNMVVGDCRLLPFADGSREVAIVQGGLHHLLELPADLDETLCEVRRVLAPGGRLVVVEPWMTPFLRLVHRLAATGAVRALVPRLDALGSMIDLEGATYRNWLDRPVPILASIRAAFDLEFCRTRRGKLFLIGRKPSR
jgi:SAM-dependent methyltransferase